MFRVSQHPSSGVLKTVTAASGTGHNTGTATSLQRGLIGNICVLLHLVGYLLILKDGRFSAWSNWITCTMKNGEPPSSKMWTTQPTSILYQKQKHAQHSDLPSSGMLRSVDGTYAA